MIYIAARYPRKLEAKALATLLNQHGLTVKSRWLDEPFSPNIGLADVSPTINAELARVDLEDIDAADTVVFLSEDPTVGIPRGARHFELGYADAKGKRIIVIGGPENIFHFLPRIVHYSTVESFLEGEA